MRFLLNIMLAIVCVACTGCKAENDGGTTPEGVAAVALPAVSSDISNLNVTSFAKDTTGHVWIGTARGLNRYNGQDFTQYFDLGSRDNYVKALCCDLKGRIWVSTPTGLSRRHSDDSFRAVKYHGDPVGVVEAIVAAPDSGVFVAKGRTIFHYDAAGERLDSIAELRRPVKWLGLDNRGRLLAYWADTLTVYNSRTFRAASKVRLGNAFRVWPVGGARQLWLLGVDGLSVYDMGSSRFVDVSALRRAYPALTDVNLKAVCEMADGNVLLSTQHQLIYCNPRTLEATDSGTDDFPFDKPEGVVNVIYSAPDDNNIWFGLEDRGFATVDATQTRFDVHKGLTKAFRGKPVTGLLMEDGILYISTRNEGLYMYDFRSGAIARHPVDGEEIMRLDRRKMPDGEPVPDSIARKLSCPDITAVHDDTDGNLWISTLYGLNRYTPSSGAVTKYFAAGGTGGNQYYLDAVAEMPDGNLVFGGMHGLTVVDPNLPFRSTPAPLAFETLKIHNSTISPTEHPEIISRGLTETPCVHLDHRSNSFSISFASLGYNSKVRPVYYHKLEGYDNYWVSTGEVSEASYANVPAGTYSLRVKTVDADTGAESEEIAIAVDIRPAPWLSWWAWLLYIATAIGIIAIVVRARSKFIRQKESARAALAEKQSEERRNEMNMNYFVNVSHEFRTPLSMIAGPVGQLLKKDDLSAENRRLLEIVDGSIGRMLKLVNRMLDFHKLENGTLHLEIGVGDIAGTLEALIGIYRLNAREKRIEFVAEGFGREMTAAFDRDKVETIVVNLLSNAMRFAPAGGTIRVALEKMTHADALSLTPETHRGLLRDANYLRISVDNSGVPVPDDKLEKIFERFYQLDGSNNGIYNHGSGIGLYFARSLATLHHGILFASNELTEGTTVFTLLIPADETAYTASELALEPEAEATAAVDADLSRSGSKGNGATAPATPDKPVVLIVDDDIDIVRYLRTLFEPHYSVITCFDASSAIREAIKSHPDLILSDVAMPGESGYDLCRKIRRDNMLCHIPVILVTAKTRVEDQVSGLGVGADAYVTKPFNPDYILALVKSTLENRQRIVAHLRNATSTKEIQDDISELDRKFMDELYKVMENEISNPELDIVRLSEILCISRTKLYYKIKSLSGTTPGNLFKTYKLNRAIDYLKENKYSLTEIAAMTGFSSREQMTTVFKKHFGVTPTEYRESMNDHR